MHLNPEICGLPASRARKRTPGLRREDVSAIAGISTAYYTWIEQGRTFDISVEILHAIAGALRLNEVETSHVFTLAGKAQPPPQPGKHRACDTAIPKLLAAFACGPALALDTAFGVVEANAPAREVFEIEPGLNLAAWLLAIREDIVCVNRETVAETLVAVLRHNRARDVDDRRLSAVVDHLREGYEPFRALWDGQLVDAPAAFEVDFRHGRLGELRFRAMLMCDPLTALRFALFMTPV